MAEDASRPENKNGRKADHSHDDPPKPGRKTVHGVGSPPLEPRPYCRRDARLRVSMPWQTLRRAIALLARRPRPVPSKTRLTHLATQWGCSRRAPATGLI